MCFPQDAKWVMTSAWASQEDFLEEAVCGRAYQLRGVELCCESLDQQAQGSEEFFCHS